jgi:hypothetical protein
MGTNELLVQFYITCIRPITEDACLVFHSRQITDLMIWRWYKKYCYGLCELSFPNGFHITRP